MKNKVKRRMIGGKKKEMTVEGRNRKDEEIERKRERENERRKREKYIDGEIERK